MVSANVAPGLLKHRAAADFLSLSDRKLTYLVADGRIPCVRIDGAVRYRRTDLEEFAAQNLEVRDPKATGPQR